VAVEQVTEQTGIVEQRLFGAPEQAPRAAVQMVGVMGAQKEQCSLRKTARSARRERRLVRSAAIGHKLYWIGSWLMNINRVFSKATRTLRGVTSLFIVAVVAGSGLQIVGIGGIGPRIIKSVKDAIERGATVEEIATLGQANGFHVTVSS
jgi:hypothetical protein